MAATLSTTVKVKVGAREVPSTCVSNTLHAIAALVTDSEVPPRSQRTPADTVMRGDEREGGERLRV